MTAAQYVERQLWLWKNRFPELRLEPFWTVSVIEAYEPARLVPPGWFRPSAPDATISVPMASNQIVAYDLARIHPPGLIWSIWPFELPDLLEPGSRRRRRRRGRRGGGDLYE